MKEFGKGSVELGGPIPRRVEVAEDNSDYPRQSIFEGPSVLAPSRLLFLEKFIK